MIEFSVNKTRANLDVDPSTETESIDARMDKRRTQ